MSKLADQGSLLPANTESADVQAIEVHNLKKSYAFKPVLRNLSLTLPHGQRMALLGANGTGKTTLLRILVGLSKAGSGTVAINGWDSRYALQEIRQSIGFVAHQPYLYEELTVLENLLFFGQLYAVPRARERAMVLLERVGMARRVNERVRALSRGQVQRVAWARALLHQPSLLLLDEPETGLDQDGSVLIDTLLAEYAAHGGSILFTTHQLERALALSDQVVIINGGKVVYQHETVDLTLTDLRQTYQGIYGGKQV
ncbi:heme ABC exporter ATP-binding protein CcmA [Dictyobacter arantiisoli]|uniref:ABC transporter ATP-binding protein n=1 Tax=Dictyobacter arantiisoli TaxID=2014874 RepID=A0A5A5TBM5_9CHLR|nr:heme ABC exporter ATP-binding protein CcmA [Dictyobacter arantiisoli]GCF08324.1 ABC transporter ATP-binding protein [Dictyobacter arantiisoli]